MLVYLRGEILFTKCSSLTQSPVFWILTYDLPQPRMERNMYVTPSMQGTMQLLWSRARMRPNKCAQKLTVHFLYTLD